MPPSFVPGARVVIAPTRDQALADARAVLAHYSVPGNLQISLFCDASCDARHVFGGIAVTYHPWLPELPISTGRFPPPPSSRTPRPRPASARRLIQRAWPIHAIFENIVAEGVGLCQALHTANSAAIHSACVLPRNGRRATNPLVDCQLLLQYVQGARIPNQRLYNTLLPVLQMIHAQVDHLEPGFNWKG